MKFSIVILLICLCMTSAFHINARSPIVSKMFRPLRMAEKEIVPVDKDNMINAATVSSAITGLLLLGPLGGLVFAGAAWNLGKKENEAGEALRGVGKAVIEAYNFLTTLNDKYKLTDKAVSAIDSAVSSSDNETVTQVKQTITEVSSKIGELNKEYDLVSKGKDLAKTAVTVTDAAIDKVIELNAQYDFVETSKKLAGTAVEKIKEQTDKK